MIVNCINFSKNKSNIVLINVILLTYDIMTIKYRYIYGPVPSWRLGRSLGVDPISMPEKICPFNCTYCQLGESVKYETERKVFVPTENILAEINSLPPDVKMDYITMSGRGEPTLALNLGEIIDGIKRIRPEPVAVLTDASLIDLLDVRLDLIKADFVMAKLDAPDEELFGKICKPAPGIEFRKILEGLKTFRKQYQGRFALQMMFVKANKMSAKKMAEIAREFHPYEVQLNTPLRPCYEIPLTKEEMAEIAAAFEGMRIVTVYDGFHDEVKPISTKDALYRRGKRI